MKSEDFVKNVLTGMGFYVKKIGESNLQTPDYYATIGSEEYIIEVKEKEDSPEHIEQFKNVPEGEVENISLALEETGPIRKIIHKIKKQIDELVESDDIFRVGWFVCSGVHNSAHEDIIFQSLYGSIPMWDKDNKFWKDTVPICYFYSPHNKFYRYRNELDAVIIGNYKTGKLCLNPYSPRYNKIKSSHILTVFENGIVDPIEEEKNKLALIVDGSVDRLNKTEVLKYLKEKYNTTLTPFPLSYHSGFTTVKHK